jgi:hypothetical protein
MFGPHGEAAAMVLSFLFCGGLFLRAALAERRESLPEARPLPKPVESAQAQLDSALQGVLGTLNPRPLASRSSKGRGALLQTAWSYVPVEYRDLVCEVDLANTTPNAAVGFLGFHLSGSRTTARSQIPAGWMLWYSHRGRVHIRTRTRTGEVVAMVLPEARTRSKVPAAWIVAQFLDVLVFPQTPDERRALALRILRRGTHQRPRSQPRAEWHGIAHGLASFEFRLPWDHSPGSRNTPIAVIFDRSTNAHWALLVAGSSPVQERDLRGQWILLGDDPGVAYPTARILDPSGDDDVLCTAPIGATHIPPLGVPKGIVPILPLHVSAVFRGFVGALSKRWQAKRITGKKNVSIGDRIAFSFRPVSPVIQIRRMDQVSAYSEGRSNQIFVFEEGHPLLQAKLSDLVKDDWRASRFEADLTLHQALRQPSGGLLPPKFLENLEGQAVFRGVVPFGSTGDVEIHLRGLSHPLLVLKTFLGPRSDVPFVHFNLDAVIRLLEHISPDGVPVPGPIKARLSIFGEPSWHLLVPRGVFYDFIFFRGSPVPWVIRHHERFLLTRYRSQIPEILRVVETEKLMCQLGGAASKKHAGSRRVGSPVVHAKQTTS